MSRPIVGVGAILIKASSQSVLIGQRLGSHGAGTFALPGGHLEYNESFGECAAREVQEETGLVVQPDAFRFAYATTDVFPELEKQYVTIFVQANVADDADAKVMEPNKCAGWTWVPWESLREQTPLFKPLATLLETDYTPFKSNR